MGYFMASVEMELKRASSAVKTDCQNQKRGKLCSVFRTLLLISVLVPKNIAEEAVFLGVSILNVNLKWFIVNFLLRPISCIAFHLMVEGIYHYNLFSVLIRSVFSQIFFEYLLCVCQTLKCQVLGTYILLNKNSSLAL